MSLAYHRPAMAITTRDETLPAAHSRTLESPSLGPLRTCAMEVGDLVITLPTSWHRVSPADASGAPARLCPFNDDPALRAPGLVQEEIER